MKYRSIIHRETLCPNPLLFKTSVVVENVNFIQFHALTHGQFKCILDEMRS